MVRLHDIAGAVAHPDHTVTIAWTDGVRGVVDFLPIIDRGGWFTPLRDGDFFTATMVVLPDGAGLTWPEEIDYSADFLRREAFPFGPPDAEDASRPHSAVWSGSPESDQAGTALRRDDEK